MLHGGVISTLLDAAMTHCLLAAGVVAVTTELVVKFRRPLRPGIDARISAVIKKNYNRLYLTAAQVTQENRVVAKADGKFFAGSHDNEQDAR
ncbi:MAG: PaaI family thioesterase, partial [Bacilli bacterium]